MLSSFLPVTITGDRQINIRELSFFEYKNLCKQLILDDVYYIDRAFKNLIDEIIEPKDKNTQLNVIDKFLILLSSRNTTLGNEFSIKHEGRRVNLNLVNILNNTSVPEIEVCDIVFTPPDEFIYTDNLDLLVKCMNKYKDINLSKFNYEQKYEICSNLNLSFKNLINLFTSEIKKHEYKIYKDVLTVNYFTSTNLLFILKLFFYENIKDLLHFEYYLKRELKFNSLDIKTYSYPELKIFNNFYQKDLKAENGSIDSGVNMDSI